ncbi:MAG: cation:proton antiporter [Magnetococcales bacterium]|nr:cation:proton antiporter [Magnetococcales bacterium]MBF0156125.1 cation:proton antiporter [Magnetococcales bacterium]
MSQHTEPFLILGALFLLGYVSDLVARFLSIPRVTLLLILGLVTGPGLLGLFNPKLAEWLYVIADLTLMLVGFRLGEHFSGPDMRRIGRVVVVLSLTCTVASVLASAALLLLAGAPLAVAILLGGISTATDPAATSDVIRETQSRGDFTQTLLGIIVIDDALALAGFSLLMATAGAGGSTSPWITAFLGLREIATALVIGVLTGPVLSFLTRRARTMESSLVATLGMLFAAGGVALWLETSFLLAAMAVGIVTVNIGPPPKHSPFRAVELVLWPFFALFFISVGAKIQPNALPAIGWIGAAYVAGRIIGRVFGSWSGGLVCQIPDRMRCWMGIALLPQASIAIGMAMIASQRFPEYSDTLLPVVVGAIVLFEIGGPVMTRLALHKVGEVNLPSPPQQRPPLPPQT